jgi:hypothetical protein
VEVDQLSDLTPVISFSFEDTASSLHVERGGGIPIFRRDEGGEVEILIFFIPFAKEKQERSPGKIITRKNKADDGLTDVNADK